MALKRPRLAIYFIFGSFVAIAVGSLLFGMVLDRSAKSNFISQAQEQGVSEVDHTLQMAYYNLLAPKLKEAPDASLEDLLDPMTLKMFAGRTSYGLNIVEIGFFDRHGHAILSTDPTGGSIVESDGPTVRNAGHGVASAHLDREVLLTDINGEAREVDVIESFAAVRTTAPDSGEEGPVIGVLRVTTDVSEALAAAESDARRNALGVSVGAGGSLFLLVLMVVLRMDIIQRKRAEEILTQHAFHDALTGLPNRSLVKDRIAETLSEAHRTKQSFAVMAMDIDRFKLVNDTYGHIEGDKLLKAVAERLQDLVREVDTVSRQGGDEFTLLLPGIRTLSDAKSQAECILESFEIPFEIGDHQFRLSASIGITFWPTDGDDAEVLLRNADIAMYRAKDDGRGIFRMFTPELENKSAERLALEEDLRLGLERDEFRVFYQPQVDIKTRTIVGMEALVRWDHPERGLVAPFHFIPVAEDTGLIVPLGEWVLRTACAQTKAWHNAGFSGLRIAVNLSARQFQQNDLAARIVRIVEETQLDTSCLHLEVTEAVAVENVERTAATLAALKEEGLGVAVDDFGTGYSSLGQLRDLPIDVLKIDRSFIHDPTSPEKAAKLVSAVIAMAHSLDLSVVAEGVETEEEFSFLGGEGCEEAQGYLFSKPVPADDFEKLLVADEDQLVA